MAVLYPLLITVHILICASLIIVVLLQSSKGEGLAGAFGGGGLSGAVFGGRGAATFLSKATSVLAICFMLSSVSLTFVSLGIRGAGEASGVIQNLKSGQTQQAPMAPSTVPGATQQGPGEQGPAQQALPGAAQPAQPGAQQGTQPATPSGGGSNILFSRPPAQPGQQPAANPQAPATQNPPPAAQPKTPATTTPGGGK